MKEYLMRHMKTRLFTFVLSLIALTFNAQAKDLPFTLTVTGPTVAHTAKLAMGDVGKGTNKNAISFKDKAGNEYHLTINYKALPANRSYPTNLDITLKDKDGKKLGYLFFAINNVNFLKKMGVFGLIVDVQGKPFDIKFTFDDTKHGQFSVTTLEKERLISDTLIPKKGFQMIRPMVLAKKSATELSQSYSLDAHPFEINYTLKNIENGLVQFQYNLNSTKDGKTQLLERIYYNADSLETLREGMFAGKYFDKDYGTFKLVYYPAMGQTAPAQK